MKNLIFLVFILLQGCTSISVGTSRVLFDDYNYWRGDYSGIVRADKKIFEYDNMDIYLEYEHISSLGSDWVTYDGVGIIATFKVEE